MAEKIKTSGLTIIAYLMILFGIAEIVTGFTHSFLGLTTVQKNIATYMGAGLGACYLASGLLLLTRTKQAAYIAIVLLAIDVAGRIGMVTAGLYPFNTPMQIFGIVAGTAIAIFFAIYIGLKLKRFKNEN